MGTNIILFYVILSLGFLISFFVRSPQINETKDGGSQSTIEALSEAFRYKSYLLLLSGFFVCGFHITLVGTHVPKYVIDRGPLSITYFGT